MKTRRKKRQEAVEVKTSRRSRGGLRSDEAANRGGAREAAVLLSSVIVQAWAVRQRRAA